MKAFIAALAVLALLVAGVILSSAAGTSMLAEYLEALPSETESPKAAADALGELRDQVEERDRLLLCSLYHHEKVDTLASAIRRAEAAAKADDETEYRILRSELESLLEDMKRDLHLHLGDIV